MGAPAALRRSSRIGILRRTQPSFASSTSTPNVRQNRFVRARSRTTASGSVTASRAERGPDREPEPDQRQDDGDHGEQLVQPSLVAMLGEREREAGEKPAEEPAPVGPVVHTLHEEAEGKEHEGPLSVLAQHHPAEDTASLPTKGHDGPEQAEDGAGRANREGNADHVRDDEPGDARDREDDDEARGPVQLLDGGTELADPEDVEDDVKDAAVQVDRGEEGPPAALGPREAAGHSERVQSPAGGREQIEAPGSEHRERIEDEAPDIQGDADRSHRVREAPVAEELGERPAEAPHSRVSSPAHQTRRRVGVGESSAGRTEDRTGRLAEHGP